MDRMKDSGSFDLGSNPGRVTKTKKAVRYYLDSLFLVLAFRIKNLFYCSNLNIADETGGILITSPLFSLL